MLKVKSGLTVLRMRRILIDEARRKHGGGQSRLNINDVELAQSTPDDRFGR
jgi:hypothetical protein